jgi:hypothetical protein
MRRRFFILNKKQTFAPHLLEKVAKEKQLGNKAKKKREHNS